MKETIRTACFAAVAAVALLVAWWAAPSSATRSTEQKTYSVGEEFYPEFKDPLQATGLKVVTFDSSLNRPTKFVVEFRDGLWTIPSHSNYPADGESRLAKTATSLLGVKREELYSENPDDQVELGVVEPNEGYETGKKGLGQRITLTKGDQVLLDLIVGKPVKGRAGYYYVRRPDEKNPTYVAKLDNIDFSTKFGDWIKTDLLEINADDITGVLINNYSVDELRQTILQGDESDLSRDKSTDPWKLKGLNTAKEELDTAKLSQLTDALDNLKLVGVRRKPAELSKILKEKGQLRDRDTVEELADRGFFVTEGELYAKFGKVTAVTNKGAVYLLRFGDADFGSAEQVESGLENGKRVSNKDAKAKKKDDKSGDSQPPRYLFVTVDFNEQYVGPKPSARPTAPVKPQPPAKPAAEKPADKTPAKPDEKPADKPDTKAPAKTAEKAAEKPAVKPEAPVKPDPAAEAEKKYQEELKKYNEAQKKYEEDLKKHEEELKDYVKKVEEGRKFVKDLNDRFADWYYVVPGDAYAQLRLTRKELVKPKQPDAKPGLPGAGAKPGIPGLEGLIPGLPPGGTAPAIPAEDDKPQIRPKENSPTPPAEKPAEKPAERSADKPAEKSSDKPAAKPPEKAADKPTGNPAEKPADKPAPAADKPAAATPDKSPPAKPADKPPTAPADKKATDDKKN